MVEHSPKILASEEKSHHHNEKWTRQRPAEEANARNNSTVKTGKCPYSVPMVGFANCNLRLMG